MGVLDQVEHRFRSYDTPPPGGTALGDQSQTAQLWLPETRRAIYSEDTDEGVRSAIWRHVAAQSASEEGQLLAVWLASPFIRRVVVRIAGRLPAERGDLESAAVLGLLESLSAVDPGGPEADTIGDSLLKAASNAAWRLATQHRKEPPRGSIRFDPVDDTADRFMDSVRDESRWELHIAPPDLDFGLAATIRFTTSKSQVEGERLGAIAEQIGLREVVHRARRPGNGTRIGRLSLLPARKP